jgi:hypothetical protein
MMTEAPPSAWNDLADDAPNAGQTDSHHSTQSNGGEGKAGAAKEQAAAVGQGAAEAGQQVASTAKDEAHNVAAETTNQAKDLLHQTRSELTDQAGTQQQRLATGLRALGDELESMTRHSEQPGPATNLAKQAASRSRDVASWLEAREPGHVVRDVQDFARKRPGMFLLMAAGAGVVAGRLGRGIKDAGTDDSTATSPQPEPGPIVDMPAGPTSRSVPDTYGTSGAAEHGALGENAFGLGGNAYETGADQPMSTFGSAESLGAEPRRTDGDLS